MPRVTRSGPDDYERALGRGSCATVQLTASPAQKGEVSASKFLPSENCFIQVEPSTTSRSPDWRTRIFGGLSLLGALGQAGCFNAKGVPIPVAFMKAVRICSFPVSGCGRQRFRCDRWSHQNGDASLSRTGHRSLMLQGVSPSELLYGGCDMDKQKQKLRALVGSGSRRPFDIDLLTALDAFIFALFGPR